MATISIADNDARVQYTQAVTANTTQLTIDFPFFDSDDINVIVTSAAGVDTTLTRGTGTGTFAVVGTSVDDGFSGGYVTLGDTYSDATTKFTIFRDIDVERTTDFPTSGPFNISSLNTELDKIFAIEQELETKIGRTMKLADSDTAATLSLPNLDTRKGTVLAFNTTTGLPEAGPEIGDVSTIAAITTDIGTLADIEDGTDATDAIQKVAAIDSNVTTVAGIDSDVTAVAGNNTDITAVAGQISPTNNISTVAGLSTEIGRLGTADAVADMNTLGTAAIVADMDALADITSEITSVAAKASFITADFVADLNTLAVTDVVNDINLLATSDIVSDLNTLATSDIVSDLNTLATTDIVNDINTLATSDIVTDLNLLATSDFVADLNTLATADVVADMDALADITSKISTVADNITDVNNFADTYFVSASAPASPTLGDLWFDTTNNVMKVYGSGGFVNAGSSVNGTANRYNYVVGTSDGSYDGSTTVFPATYDAGYVDVYLNGAKLVVTSDFTATNGTSVTLGTAANTGDVVDIVGYGTFTAATALSLGDNEKIQLGAGNDLEIFHNGTNSVIKDNGVGRLNLVSDGPEINLQSGTEYYIQCINNGAVRLYNNGDQKIQTTSTGIDVTGEVQGDSLDIDGAADISGDLTVDTNTLHVDATNNRVGVGTTSPSDTGGFGIALDVSSSTGAAVYVRDSGGSKTGHFGQFNEQTSIVSRQDDGNIAFYTGATPSERLRVKSDGDISITDGNLILASGHGIDFSATSDSSGTVSSELLDEYEEGTYSPTVSGSTVAGTGTFSSLSGAYTKIGNRVFVSVLIAHSNTHTLTGAYQISLPFTSTANGGGGFVSYKTGWVTNGPDMADIATGQALCYLRYDTNTSIGDIPGSYTQNGSTARVHIIYDAA